LSKVFVVTYEAPAAEGPFVKKKKRKKSGLRRLRKYNINRSGIPHVITSPLSNQWVNFRVFQEEAEQLQQKKDAEEATYFSVQAEPSRQPARHFCSVCGCVFITLVEQVYIQQSIEPD